jgi:TRAP-type C4-dicarboxylate transport system permease small subunit
MADSSFLDTAVRLTDRCIMVLGAVALVLMMVHISIDVVANLMFGAPVALTNAAVTMYYMIAVAFLPLAAGEYRSAHIGVDLVVNYLPAVPRRWLDHLVQVLCAVIYSVLAIQSWQLALQKLAANAYLMEQTTRVSIWPSYFLIPTGFGLIAALIIVRLMCRVLGRPEPAAPQETAEEKLLEKYGDV